MPGHHPRQGQGGDGHLLPRGAGQTEGIPAGDFILGPAGRPLRLHKEEAGLKPCLLHAHCPL